MIVKVSLSSDAAPDESIVFLAESLPRPDLLSLGWRHSPDAS